MYYPCYLFSGLRPVFIRWNPVNRAEVVHTEFIRLPADCCDRGYRTIFAHACTYNCARQKSTSILLPFILTSVVYVLYVPVHVSTCARVLLNVYLYVFISLIFQDLVQKFAQGTKLRYSFESSADWVRFTSYTYERTCFVPSDFRLISSFSTCYRDA